MTDFSVEANYLTGTIPPEIGGLASLEDLRLNGNRFWGELPHTLTALSRLRRLEYDELPHTLTALSRIQGFARRLTPSFRNG